MQARFLQRTIDASYRFVITCGQVKCARARWRIPETMFLRKQPFIALLLLLALAGVLNAQTQTAQKNKKEKEILSTAPKPIIQLSDHPLTLMPCADSASEAQIP